MKSLKPHINVFSLLLLLVFACEEEITTNSQSAVQNSFLNEAIFPAITQHTHGASIVELPNGDLLTAWFQGSGERWADDVAIMGARLIKGSTSWTKPFVLADVEGFPDVNPCLFLDSQQRLWLSWYTVMANLWESSLPKYRISDNYMMADGPPAWKWQEVLHVKPGGSTERGIQPDDPFVASVASQMDAYEIYLRDTLNASSEIWEGWKQWREQKLGLARGDDFQFNGYLYDEAGNRTRQLMGYPLSRRIGWQTKNKALLLGKRLILPLYSDGLGFSIFAITDNDGESWQFSQPLVGFENIQASTVSKKDGTLVTYMRDNGPPPQRLQRSTSSDKGLSWSPTRDASLPNPGSGADLATLGNGHWVIAYNDTEDGRHSLAVSLSEDEGKSWAFTRHLVLEEVNNGITGAYPAVIQGNNDIIHIVYSYVEPGNEEGKRETIRYARLTEDWIKAGD